MLMKIYALKVESLLKMNRHNEAERTWTSGPKFQVDEFTKYFGPIGLATLLVVRAQVDLVAGRSVISSPATLAVLN